MSQTWFVVDVLLDRTTLMPLNREQIKHAPVSNETWRNNSTSVLTFDPRKIRPLTDHILVELEEATDPSTLVIPDVARNKDIGTRTGTVLAVGPGKWHEKPGLSWELTKQVFKPTILKPGDRVIIGHYSDWESWNASADGHQSRDNNIVLCQEADVRLYRPGKTNKFIKDRPVVQYFKGSAESV